ncbi:transporter [Vibrio marisflavi]|uniref:Uncharacterized protein n=1 Tax=Vibrio marisflavi CECT 7928 TaxID=634439 RepID=A0ABN8E4G1_9VIBR|nr:transporter [Vibrio marisflavi]CAH0540347.1 hypothetical protein VMF7928_02792 [Vibrio marisflavi CECT 7928]
MDLQELNHVEFDYTSFLGASCDKEWTFLEAVNACVSTVRDNSWGNNKEVVNISPQERLWGAALRILSTRHSDESNLIALCDIAKSESISVLKLIMPYALSQTQLDNIKTKTGVEISKLASGVEDEFLIQFN